MLQGNGVTKKFGGLVAVNNVDFIVKKGEIVGLIGPNGSGKTTLLNLISGVYHPTSGMIKFREKDISRLSPHNVCRLGIGRTFQLVKPFLKLSVLENVIVSAAFGRKKSLADARDKALQCLEFVGLKEKKDLLSESLNLHERKLLEVARAISIDPHIILLDEVISGLNPAETLRAMEVIKRIRDELGVTVFWVEHVMKAVLGVAERIIVLNYGQKIADATPKEIISDEKVIEAYLGEKYIF